MTGYALDGQSAVREEVAKPDSTTETVTYLTGPRGPEYRRSSDGTLRWYVYDGLGSVIGEVDENGDLKSAGFADVYGFARASWKATGETVSRHQFVGSLGHVSEDETGLVYMRARYMDPALGRFLSEDPAHDGANWFVYCANDDPVNAVDQDGKVVLTLLEKAALALLGIDFIGRNFVQLPPSVEHTIGMLEIALGMDFVDKNFRGLATGERAMANADLMMEDGVRWTPLSRQRSGCQ